MSELFNYIHPIQYFFQPKCIFIKWASIMLMHHLVLALSYKVSNAKLSEVEKSFFCGVLGWMKKNCYRLELIIICYRLGHKIIFPIHKTVFSIFTSLEALLLERKRKSKGQKKRTRNTFNSISSFSVYSNFVRSKQNGNTRSRLSLARNISEPIFSESNALELTDYLSTVWTSRCNRDAFLQLSQHLCGLISHFWEITKDAERKMRIASLCRENNHSTWGERGKFTVTVNVDECAIEKASRSYHLNELLCVGYVGRGVLMTMRAMHYALMQEHGCDVNGFFIRCLSTSHVCHNRRRRRNKSSVRRLHGGDGA